MARRTIRCRLDRHSSRPWSTASSQFLHPNLELWTQKNRAQIVRAILILIQSWIAAGEPAWPGKPLGSYEEWCRVVGGVLEFAGITGFLENLEAHLSSSDDETEELEIFVENWWHQFSNRMMKPLELVTMCLNTEILAEARGTGNEASQSIKMGNLLKSLNGRIIGKYCVEIVKNGGPRHGRWYRLNNIQTSTPNDQGLLSKDGEGRGSLHSLKDSEDFKSVKGEQNTNTLVYGGAAASLRSPTSPIQPTKSPLRGDK